MVNPQPVRSQPQQKSTDIPRPSTNKTAAKTTEKQQQHPQAETIKSANHSKANEFKDKGNICVKANDFKKAVGFYTEAIRSYKFDPVYFSNRALCYLKLKRYVDCIEDCSIAIQLEPTCVKAFYRRMQANDAMANVDEALKDCEKVLQLEPNNKDARHKQETLKEKLQKCAKATKSTKKADNDEQNFMIRETSSTKGQKPKTNFSPQSIKVPKTESTPVPWSHFDEPTDLQIDFVDRPPHLRPIQPLHKIKIKEVLEFDEIMVQKPSPPPQASQSASQTLTILPSQPSQPSQEIEKTNMSDIVNNNIAMETIESVKSINKDCDLNKIKPDLDSSVPPASVNTKIHQFDVPETTTQFYQVWASLETDHDKYTLLKVNYEFH